MTTSPAPVGSATLPPIPPARSTQHSIQPVLPPNLPSVPIGLDKQGPFVRLNAFLDKHVLPYPVKYLTNRITILGTLSLLVPLILFANVTVFVLATNSYLNVMSVVVSSTVLLYSTLSEARDKAAAERREVIAAQHDQMVEARATADHQRIQEIHDHLDQIQALLSAQLVEIENENQVRYKERHEAVMSEITAHKQEMDNMRTILQAIQAGKDNSAS